MKRVIFFLVMFFGIGIAIFLLGFELPAWLAVLILCIAIVCDSTTTYVCYRMGGKEANPVARFLMNKIGILGAIGVYWLIWAAIVYFRVLELNPISQTAIGIAYWMVPLNNLIAMRKYAKIIKARESRMQRYCSRDCYESVAERIDH